MSGHNVCFHGERRKIVFELSLIPLISVALLSTLSVITLEIFQVVNCIVVLCPW